jgi:hypothetical protein
MGGFGGKRMAGFDPTPEEIARWDRWFAVESNNRAWDLLAQPARTAEEDRELLAAPHAAAFHWARVGKAINIARSDSLLAHVHARLGDGASARRHAVAYLAYCAANACEDWDLAFAHAAMALAAWASDDAARHAESYRLARAAGEAIQDPADREAFFHEFDRIPRPH